jgi:hypothetical protein
MKTKKIDEPYRFVVVETVGVDDSEDGGYEDRVAFDNETHAQLVYDEMYRSTDGVVHAYELIRKGPKKGEYKNVTRKFHKAVYGG